MPSSSALKDNPHRARFTATPHLTRLRALALLEHRPDQTDPTVMPMSEKLAQVRTSSRSTSAGWLTCCSSRALRRVDLNEPQVSWVA